MPFANAQERQVAEKVLAAIRSEKYKGKNYLFLDPFDVNEVPGYFEKIGPPLDLRTVHNRLEADEYDNTTFYNDLSKVFQNAIKYHASLPQTKWIAKLAKDMLKAVGRERKNAEQGGEKKKSKNISKLKIKLKPSPTEGKQGDKKGSVVETSSKPPPPNKPKLKLKFSTKPAAAAAASSDAPKVVPKKAKPTQPKVKLKLPPKKPPDNKKAGTEKKEEKTTTSVKISASNPSRGKELPQGVQAAQPPPLAKPAPPAKKSKKTSASKATTSKATMSKAAASATSKKSSSSVSKVSGGSGGAATASATKQLDAVQIKRCTQVLLGLRRRKHKHISWFVTPVPKAILADYRSKIKHSMDLQTIQNKLDKNSYKSLSAFVLDVRRVFANALRYNTSIKDSLRPLALECLKCSEQMLQMFLLRHYPDSYPPLLYCWNVCIDIIDTLYNLVNPADGQPMAYYFLHPVSVYCGGKFPPDYLEKVSKPMDFGTVTANLIEGKYKTAHEFDSDCRLVLQNCETYYKDREDGKLFVDQARKLNDMCLSTQLQQLARYDKSSKAEKQRQGKTPQQITNEYVVPHRPPPSLFQAVLTDMRNLTYTDKATKITEPAMIPFEKPVSLQVFTDYTQVVAVPMDLQTIERKLGTYETPEDFEYDMNLIWKNSELYNSRRNDQHSVNMAKFAARKFRIIFYAKVQAFEDPASVPSEPAAKKIKLEKTVAPRISISAAALARSPSLSSPQQPKKAAQQQQPKPVNKASNQPVPLHIAIAKVKEAFPLRRAVKTLQSWEADCARYFKELMRHPWITTTRPKFIFHVPVTNLFPELKDHYAAKIRTPMDLTTVECTLLAGNRYAAPEDFLQDVALVFTNAIRFNKDGKDIGDPLSCAYYDASVHLLKYSRWLSMELLSSYIDNRSDHTDEGGADGLPPFTWKLTEGNRINARQEMESIVLKEPIEKSLEGDRFTWMEAECEKLLKALRHQSDLRYMTFFIQANYPADYAAFISKPMDWEKVQRTLKKRNYDTIGQIIDDLRLIFSNALKYNSRLKGTDTVSGRAYEAARYMSNKLENAINKLLLSASDRLERERIDHANAEREIEAAERAEEAAIRAAWKKAEGEKDGQPPPKDEVRQPQQIEQQKTRIVRKLPLKRQTTDFEIPFFDDVDDGQHERSYFEVVKFQKSMFEKQRQDLVKMRKASAAIGVSVLTRLIRRDIEQRQSAKEQPVAMETEKTDTSEKNGEGADGASAGGLLKPSAVLRELERDGRGPLKMQLKVQSKPKKRIKKRGLPKGFD